MMGLLKRIAFYGTLVAIPAIALIILDMIAGGMGGTHEIRNASRMFRSEAAPLFLNTRRLLPGTIHNYLYGARVDPRYEGDPKAPRVFRTNDLGTIKGHNDDLSTPPERTILFLGGSTTESNEVDEEFRFPGLVGKRLSNTAGKPFQGINLGVRGNSSRDSVNLLLNHPVVRTADTVVLMHNINDRLLMALRRNYDTPIDGPVPIEWSAVSSAIEGTWASLWDYLSHKSNLIYLFRFKVLDGNPWTGDHMQEGVIDESAIDFKDANLDNSAEEFRTSLRTFVAVTIAMGKRPVLMTQTLGRKSEPQAVFNQITREVAIESKAFLIDTERALDGRERGLFLSDDIHLNNEGSRVIARIVTEVMASQVFQISPSKTSFADTSLLLNPSVCRPPNNRPSVSAPGNRHLLVRQPGRYPVFSPDGRWLLYQGWTGKREVVELFDMKEGRSKTISDSESTAEDRHATFFRSPEGQLQVIFGRKEKGVERLYVAPIVGGDVVPLPLPPLMSASIPAAKEGTIFFAGSMISPNGQYLGAPDLYRWQDGALTQLTKTSWEEWRPALDPSGRYLFHIANQDGQFDIVRLDVNTKETTRFFGTNTDEWDPDVSPDGKWVVFASKASGNWDLLITPTEAPDNSVTLIDGKSDDWDPRFTPDGRAVLFASSNAGAPPFMYFVCPFGEFAR